ncbi:uncharacterized protein LOC105738905 [Nomascus leucogenys]|uniref:uncharacterized protein LOC105738905 n=1 Tax=Nomascus leucogenys TaxID=61853 RepID=UPI00062AA6B9|nr:uncharacterized protein LOC105738905 [Nomascus leucogenys]
MALPGTQSLGTLWDHLAISPRGHCGAESECGCGTLAARPHRGCEWVRLPGPGDRQQTDPRLGSWREGRRGAGQPGSDTVHSSRHRRPAGSTQAGQGWASSEPAAAIVGTWRRAHVSPHASHRGALARRPPRGACAWDGSRNHQVPVRLASTTGLWKSLLFIFKHLGFSTGSWLLFPQGLSLRSRTQWGSQEAAAQSLHSAYGKGVPPVWGGQPRGPGQCRAEPGLCDHSRHLSPGSLHFLQNGPCASPTRGEQTRPRGQGPEYLGGGHSQGAQRGLPPGHLPPPLLFFLHVPGGALGLRSRASDACPALRKLEAPNWPWKSRRREQEPPRD